MDDARLRTVERSCSAWSGTATSTAGRSPAATSASCAAGRRSRWRRSSATTTRTCGRWPGCWPCWTPATRRPEGTPTRTAGDLAGLARAFARARRPGRGAGLPRRRPRRTTAAPPIEPPRGPPPVAIARAAVSSTPTPAPWWAPDGPPGLRRPTRGRRRSAVALASDRGRSLPRRGTRQRIAVDRAHLLRRLGRCDEAAEAWTAIAAGPVGCAIVAWIELAKLREHRLATAGRARGDGRGSSPRPTTPARDAASRPSRRTCRGSADACCGGPAGAAARRRPVQGRRLESADLARGTRHERPADALPGPSDVTAARSGTPSRPTPSTASDPAAAANRRSAPAVRDGPRIDGRTVAARSAARNVSPAPVGSTSPSDRRRQVAQHLGGRPSGADGDQQPAFGALGRPAAARPAAAGRSGRARRRRSSTSSRLTPTRSARREQRARRRGDAADRARPARGRAGTPASPTADDRVVGDRRRPGIGDLVGDRHERPAAGVAPRVGQRDRRAPAARPPARSGPGPRASRSLWKIGPSSSGDEEQVDPGRAKRVELRGPCARRASTPTTAAVRSPSRAVVSAA